MFLPKILLDFIITSFFFLKYFLLVGSFLFFALVLKQFIPYFATFPFGFQFLSFCKNDIYFSHNKHNF